MTKQWDDARDEQGTTYYEGDMRPKRTPEADNANGRDVIDVATPPVPDPFLRAMEAVERLKSPMQRDPHNAAEAEADDRRLLTSLTKIDDVDAKLWRMQERLAACEKNNQRMASRLDAIVRPKGNPMIKWFFWGTAAVIFCVAIFLLIRIAVAG